VTIERAIENGIAGGWKPEQDALVFEQRERSQPQSRTSRSYPNGHVEWHEAKGEWTLLAALKLGTSAWRVGRWGVMPNGLLRHAVFG
jgi:hypothetical protein